MTASGSEAIPRPGEVIAQRYRIVSELGTGGMGTVYRVEHTHMGKPMALKLLRPELSSIPEIAERFQREARSAARLDDPHIVRVTDFGETERGDLFLIMELLDGVPLSRRIREQGAFTVDEAIDVVDQILSALEHAHVNDVIHRDLKPDNIMLLERPEGWVVKILDFGLAKITDQEVDERRPLTQAGVVFGTPRYMSPEQAAGETADARSDLYSVGVLLYELLAGRCPFTSKSAVELLRSHLLEPVPPLALGHPDPDLSERLEAIVQKALAKQKGDRFANAREFREALFECRSDVPAGIEPTKPRFSPLARGQSLPRAQSVPPTRIRPPSTTGAQTSVRPGATLLPRSIIRVDYGAKGIFAALFIVLIMALGITVLVREDRTPEMLFEEALTEGNVDVAVGLAEGLVNGALAKGNKEDARRVVDRLLHQHPLSARGHLLAGHVAVDSKSFQEAADHYGTALDQDSQLAGDERLIANARRLLHESDGIGYTLLRLIEEKGDKSAVPFLSDVASEGPNARTRRRAIQGLRKHRELSRVDAFSILARDLRATPDNPCKLRKWYVEQLLDLPKDETNSKALLETLKQEDGRMGSLPFGLARPNACFEGLLRREIKRLETKARSG